MSKNVGLIQSHESNFYINLIADFTSAGQQSWGSGSSGSPGPGQTEGSDKKKKRKSRWAQDSEMEKTVIPGLPTVIPTGLSADQENQYLSKCKIMLKKKI